MRVHDKVMREGCQDLTISEDEWEEGLLLLC